MEAVTDTDYRSERIVATHRPRRVSSTTHRGAGTARDAGWERVACDYRGQGILLETHAPRGKDDPGIRRASLPFAEHARHRGRRHEPVLAHPDAPDTIRSGHADDRLDRCRVVVPGGGTHARGHGTHFRWGAQEERPVETLRCLTKTESEARDKKSLSPCPGTGEREIGESQRDEELVLLARGWSECFYRAGGVDVEAATSARGVDYAAGEHGARSCRVGSEGPVFPRSPGCTPFALVIRVWLRLTLTASTHAVSIKIVTYSTIAPVEREGAIRGGGG